MNKIKILALFGESSSGKDYWQKQIVLHYGDKAHSIVSCTTRPPRDYEVNGVDYHFLTPDQFGEKVLNGDMLEATSFRNWFYGTALSSLDPNKVNVGVFNPQGMECIIDDSRLDVTPVYIYSSPKVRLLRSLQREENPDCDEICRRYFTDKEDFERMDDFDAYVYNNNPDKAKYQLYDEYYVKQLFNEAES